MVSTNIVGYYARNIKMVIKVVEESGRCSRQPVPPIYGKRLDKWLGPPVAKQYKLQSHKSEKVPFLDMKTSWYPEGDLWFGVYCKTGKQLKLVRKYITHTPGTVHVIPWGALQLLAKVTSKTPEYVYVRVYILWPDHKNSLQEAVLVTSILPTMGELQI